MDLSCQHAGEGRIELLFDCFNYKASHTLNRSGERGQGGKFSRNAFVAWVWSNPTYKCLTQEKLDLTRLGLPIFSLSSSGYQVLKFIWLHHYNSNLRFGPGNLCHKNQTPAENSKLHSGPKFEFEFGFGSGSELNSEYTKARNLDLNSTWIGSPFGSEKEWQI